MTRIPLPSTLGIIAGALIAVTATAAGAQTPASTASAASATPAAAPLAAATASAPQVRLRGTIERIGNSAFTLRLRNGESMELQLPANVVVNEVYPMALEQIQAGSYIGTAAMPQADGTQKAIAITVFPEAARGTGEGHRPFDLMPQSTMTNATVSQVNMLTSGRTLRVKFKDTDMNIVVPQDVPVVTFKPADASLLVQGASVSLSAQLVNDKPTALRINAGRNGFVLPY